MFLLMLTVTSVLMATLGTIYAWVSWVQIAAVIIGDEATLKRVYYYPDKQKLVLQAENPKYEPFVYVGSELDEINIIGKAIAFQSDVI